MSRLAGSARPTNCYRIFRSRSFKGAGFGRGRGRRGGRFFDARRQVRARGGGILPFAFGDLHRQVNRQAHEAAVLVNPARWFNAWVSAARISASALARTAARSASIAGTDVENRTFTTKAANKKHAMKKADADRPDGAFVVHCRPPVVEAAPEISSSAG